MKKILLLIAILTAGFFRASGFSSDDARQAMNGALEQAKASIRTAPFAGKTVAVLPLYDDYLTGKLKNILTESGVVCVDGKEDPMWNEIIREIAWDERKNDILDPATIVKFGKLKAAQILIYGKMTALDQNADRVYAEIELHATDLATKQHIWGGTFACRFYTGQDVHGIISLDNNLKTLLRKGFQEAENSIQSPEYASKLDKVNTITVIPLAGDIDQYMTGLAIETLTRTKHTPKNPQIPSLAQVRAFARDGQLGSDAVLYGAIRDLRMSKHKEKKQGSKMVAETIVNVDIQLYIEDVKNGNVLWSKTITLEETIAKERELTSQEKADAVPAAIKEDLADNWKSYAKVIAWVIGALLVLAIAGIAVKSYFSYNNVR